MAKKNQKIAVQGTDITIARNNEQEYISLTDIARHRDQSRTDDLIRNWLRNRNTIEFLGIWEQLNNPDFKSVEFDGFKIQAGLNSFTLTPKQWVERTGAFGLISKAGRYGGTFAHKDIAIAYAGWCCQTIERKTSNEMKALLDTKIIIHPEAGSGTNNLKRIERNKNQ